MCGCVFVQALKRLYGLSPKSVHVKKCVFPLLSGIKGNNTTFKSLESVKLFKKISYPTPGLLVLLILHLL